MLAKLHAAGGVARAATSAAGIDFGTSIEQQESRADGGVDDEVFLAEVDVACYSCGKIGVMRTCKTSVPQFKELLLMAFFCDECGYRNSEIKEGGEIGDRGKKITLHVKGDAQLSRDVFKCTAGGFSIPEVDLEAAAGTLGSIYTTVEGLLAKMLEGFQRNSFATGDSATSDDYRKFLKDVEDCKEGRRPFTLVIDDPTDNCFLYNPHAPGPDPDATIEYYERSREQDEELGIAGMNVGADHGGNADASEGGDNEPVYIETVDVSKDRGIVKKVIKAGEGELPKKGQEVAVRYEGRLDDGTVFDAS